MYPIQKDIPIPKVNHDPRKGRTKYAFETMAVGDMFFVPNKAPASIAAHVSAVAKKLGREFTTRKAHMLSTGQDSWALSGPEDPDAVEGVGVWRIK